MRHIGDLENLGRAEAFSAYLLVEGIESKLETTGGVVEVWIRDEDQFDRARRELQQFEQAPDDSRYTDAISEARRIAKEKAKRKREIQKRIVEVGATGALGPPPRVTIGLIVISGVVALVSGFGEVPDDHVINQWLQLNAVGPPDSAAFLQLNPDSVQVRLASVLRGEVWRLVTPIFIHYGVVHLLFNMYMLFVFGNRIERRYGSGWFLGLVLVTAVLSTLAQGVVPADWQGSQPFYIPQSGWLINKMGGMSGVVYGLFGFVWMKAVYDPQSTFWIPPSTVLILMGWLVGCIFAKPLIDAGIPIFPDNMANWAHGVGLLVGLVIGYTTSISRIGPR